MTIYKLAIDNDTTAYTCTKSNLDEVLHAACCTIGHFTDSRSISIIGNGNRHTYTVLEKLGKLDNSFPR